MRPVRSAIRTARSTTLAAAALVATTAAAALAEVPLRLVQTISLPGVPGRIDHLAIDLPGRRLYLAVPARGAQQAEIRVYAVAR